MEMNRNRELEILQNSVIEVMQCDISEIEPKTTFEGDLGADSLDAYQILLLVQDQIGVDLPIERVEQLQTIEDAYKLICEALGKEAEEI